MLQHNLTPREAAETGAPEKRGLAGSVMLKHNLRRDPAEFDKVLNQGQDRRSRAWCGGTFGALRGTFPKQAASYTSERLW